MGMSTGQSRGGVKSDINVTPLVDVCLVLLIIFMVITPMLQRGKEVQLPRSHTIQQGGEQDEDPIILSLTKAKEMYVEQDKYDEAGFLKAVQTKMADSPGKKLVLKGDQALTFGDVRKVMNLTRKAGAKGIGLAVDEIKKDGKDGAKK